MSKEEVKEKVSKAPKSTLEAGFVGMRITFNAETSKSQCEVNGISFSTVCDVLLGSLVNIGNTEGIKIKDIKAFIDIYFARITSPDEAIEDLMEQMHALEEKATQDKEYDNDDYQGVLPEDISLADCKDVEK